MDELNNVILTDKHYYVQTLFDINEIKKDIDLKVARDEISESQSKEINIIWNYLFAELIREGLKYDYIRTGNSRDIVRITIDNIQFDCFADKLKEIFGSEYDEFINPEKCNFKIIQNDISLMTESEKTDKEAILEKELKELKEKTSLQIKELQYTINHDAPTGLKNKKAYAETIKTITPPYALISLDVNNLKETNDTYGHQAGDRLLKNTAKALTMYFKHECFRTGGDEFVIITKKEEQEIIECLENASNILQQIKDGLLYSFAYGYAFNDGKQTPDDVFKLADQRMYENKKKYKAANNIPPRQIDEPAEDNEQRVIEYNYKDEQYKGIDSFIYDAYELSLIPPGGGQGEKIRMIVAPLYIYEDNGHVPVMVVMLNKMGRYETFISKEQPALQITFDENEYLVRGIFSNGKFQSHILLAGNTRQMGYNLNIDNSVEYRSVSPEKTNYGHISIEFQGYRFHIVPLANKNDNNGIAQCLIGIDSPTGKRMSMLTNFNGYTTFVGTDKHRYQIVTYWQEEVLCAEIIPQR